MKIQTRDMSGIDSIDENNDHRSNGQLTFSSSSSSRQPIFPLLPLAQMPDDPTYIAHEEKIVHAWNGGSETQSDLYSRIVEKNKDSSEYVFLDGPPFVSGTLHPGHVAVGAVKSIVSGHQNMKGKSCNVKLGYDCHGLPAVNKTAQENGLDTLEKIHSLGMHRFNEMCDTMINKYSSSWTPLIQRLGRLADFDNVYMTRDVNFMETCFWIFKEIWNKGLVYKGNKVMAYSYSNQTPLSNFEAALNYRDKESKSIYVRFELEHKSDHSDHKEYVVAWTTTPWTLPANLALCVNPELEYVCLTVADEPGVRYIVGKQCVNNLFTIKQKVTILDTFKGSKLVGLRYKPLFPFTQQIDKDLSIDRVYKIVGDSYVQIGEIGTAVVHLAPAFGDDDFRVCCANGLIDNTTVSEYCPLDAAGQYIDRIQPYAGRLVFDCENDIRADLKKTGDLLKTQLYKHSYPYCWRSDTPLIYRTTPSWYIRVTALKDRLIELNKTVNWYPPEIGENRFHQWLSGAKDWAISRSTSYATPIPIWVSDQGETLCVGSIAELEGLTGQKISNLHPEYLNDLTFYRDGKIYRRIPDTFDCWFESGAAPMGQLHYPFAPESKILDSREYLSDFICEGMDQTRGWFYTLLILSTIIFDRAPYRNVMCTGMVLDRNGQRFSKKLGNYVDPMISISEYGADIIRVFFANSPVISADSVKFNEEHIAKLKRRFTPYYNGVKFWIEHTLNYMKANGIEQLILDPIERKEDSLKFKNLFDQWIILRTDELVRKVNIEMDRFHFGNACDLLLDFIEDLTNWYIKFNRDRLKGMERSEKDWLDSITVLYNVLMIYCRLWAPFTPFLSEHIYQHLRCCSARYRLIDSVLLTQYPESQTQMTNSESEDVLVMFRDLQRVCAMVRGMRDETNPKKRLNDGVENQNNDDKPKSMHSKMVVPLLSCTIYHDDEKYMNVLEKNIHLVQSELNCLTFLFKKLQDNVKINVEIDRSSIGKFFRKDANDVIKIITSQSDDFLTKLDNGEVHFKYKSNTYDEILDERFYKLQRVPGSILDRNSNEITKIDRDLMVTIDCTYNKLIHDRYQVKRLHSAIQNIRKQMALRPWNKIMVVLDGLYADASMINSLSESLTNAEICSCDFTYNIGFPILINAINGMIKSGVVATDHYIGFSDTFKLEGFDQTDTNYIEGRLMVFHFKSSQ